MKFPFSVLLLRPDDVTDDPAHDTFYTHPVATCPADAVKRAQIEACRNDDQGLDRHEDYVPLLVLLGHQYGLDPEAKETEAKEKGFSI
jgi:hypothetical protein